MEEQEKTAAPNPDLVYRGSPAAYPRREPNVPFRAQLAFIGAMIAFGAGTMLSLAVGWMPGIVVSVTVALLLAAVPFGAGWLHIRPDPNAVPENVTASSMGPGPGLYPALEADAHAPPGANVERSAPPPPP